MTCTGTYNTGCRCASCKAEAARRRAKYRVPEGNRPLRVPGDWASDGLCRTVGPSVFYDVDTEHVAKSICASCPVAEACRDYAIEARESEGIWGGLNPTERHNLRRNRQRKARRAAA